MHRPMFALAACALALSAAPAYAEHFSTRLSGFQELPALMSDGKGTLDLHLDRHAQTISYTLTFSGLSAPVTQSHIHFGKVHVAGSIVVFFCSNLGNGPAGTQACPAAGGTVTGTISAADVLPVAAQHFPAADFNALVRAITSDTAYANVHTTNFPAGEIRGQIRRGDRDDD